MNRPLAPATPARLLGHPTPFAPLGGLPSLKDFRP